MGKLDGKVALITGAGSGIGRASAIMFAAEGAKVVVADYAPRGGRETIRLIKHAGGKAIFVKADVSRATDVEIMVKTTLDTYGRIDILYNNAGILGRPALTSEITEEEWDSVISTNLKGVFLGSKYAIPVMIKQGGGIIISTASATSIEGLAGTPGLPAYGASKGAIVQLTKTMALEYAKHNIRVNCICPGGTETPMSDSFLVDDSARRAFEQTVPMGRLGRPDEIARGALYLASDDSSYMTGASLVVNGGA